MMYKRFYGLMRSPFELSPDPHFFFPTRYHTEAFAILNYCVFRRKGFVVVSGEVGTGKTLMLRCLLDALNKNKIASAFVYNPQLSVPEFLAYVLTDLRVPLVNRTKGEMLSALNEFLLLRSRRGTTTVLVVDEAQLLTWELMEEIRLLTNLETSQYKLLQIVMVGQPELDLKIDSEELRQLKQRITMRCRLEPLGFQDLRGYIHRRLEVAGANSRGTKIFSEQAIEAIYHFSGGIPRLINTLCENSLIYGYGKQAKPITLEIVQESAMDLRLNHVSEPTLVRSETHEERKRAVGGMSD
jgi:general secretion pathway protein A